MLAAVFGHDGIVSLLLAAGADVTLIDSLGLTAMEWAVRRGFSNVAQLIANASTPKLPPQTNETAVAIDLEAPSENRIQARSSIEAVHGRRAAETEIASKTQGARTEANAKPKAGLLDILRARAAQMAAADSEAATLRNQAVIAQSDSSETLQGARTEQLLKPATPEAQSAETTRESTKLRLAPDRTFEESRRVVESPLVYHPRETTRLSSVEVPSFDQLPANAAGRPMLWVMIVVTLCGAAFATYRLTNHSSETVTPAPAVATKTEQPTLAAANPSPVGGVTESAMTTEKSVASPEGDLPVTGDALAGAEIKLPKAEYPKSVRSRGISGTITVTVRVNRAGKVISWVTSTGDPRLRAAALKAAKKATFAPQKLPGKGEVVGTITYNFK
jgi:TonB family protein